MTRIRYAALPKEIIRRLDVLENGDVIVTINTRRKS